MPFVCDLSVLHILLIIYDTMRSTRVRKLPNREPKSLAIATPIRPRVLQLQQVIDSQILELDTQRQAPILNTTEQLEFDSIELAQSNDLSNDLPDDATSML
jgi:hypothetical protein